MATLPELNPDLRTPTRANRVDPIIDPNNVLIPRDLPAVALLTQRMIKARSENPRGELYRELDNATLVNMLCQNVEELIIALRYNNDVADKCGDVANFVSMLLHNAVSPRQPETADADMPTNTPPDAPEAPTTGQSIFTGVLADGAWGSLSGGGGVARHVPVRVGTVARPQPDLAALDRARRSYFPPDAQPDEPDTLVQSYAKRRTL